MWMMDSGYSRHMIGIAKWFSNLTPMFFMWLILVGLCFVSFSVLDSFGGHSMNTHESNMRFHILMDSLTPFLSGLGRVHRHAFRASFVDPRFCPYNASFSSSHVVPFRDSRRFSNDCLVLFLELIFWHVSKRDSNTLFLNQILHLANPHDKLSTFMLYPNLGFSSIYGLTLWDPRLRHLSLSLVTCTMEVL
jgi:hypothetical protein